MHAKRLCCPIPPSDTVEVLFVDIQRRTMRFDPTLTDPGDKLSWVILYACRVHRRVALAPNALSETGARNFGGGNRRRQRSQSGSGKGRCGARSLQGVGGLSRDVRRDASRFRVRVGALLRHGRAGALPDRASKFQCSSCLGSRIEASRCYLHHVTKHED